MVIGLGLVRLGFRKFNAPATLLYASSSLSGPGNVMKPFQAGRGHPPLFTM